MITQTKRVYKINDAEIDIENGSILKKFMEKSKTKKLLTFKQLQTKFEKWANYNFPNSTDWQCLLGVGEEMGELFHAHLKESQKIRKQDYRAKKKDAIGDIIMFLTHYCIKEGFDMQDIVSEVWEEISLRDWVKYKKDGLTK